MAAGCFDQLQGCSRPGQLRVPLLKPTQHPCPLPLALPHRPIARSKSKISVAEASRIAAEIERGDRSSANIHQLEERGVAIDDSQMDEEDRYGAVVRPGAPQPQQPASAAANGGGGAAPPRPNAWAQGRPKPLMPGAAPSAPISIDTRKEANKLRAQVGTLPLGMLWALLRLRMAGAQAIVI
jgi:hypothetical protein